MYPKPTVKKQLTMSNNNNEIIMRNGISRI